MNAVSTPERFATAVAEWRAVLAGEREPEPLSALVRRHGIPRSALIWWLRRNGLRTGLPPGDMLASSKVRAALALWRQALAQDGPACLAEVARSAGVSRMALFNAAKRLGLPTRRGKGVAEPRL